MIRLIALVFLPPIVLLVGAVAVLGAVHKTLRAADRA